LRNKLEVHLTGLQRQRLIEPWHDRRIVPGQELEHEIGRHFASADIVLLLVSPDFIASNYCYDVEMKGALQRHERKEAIVIPVILRPCDWHPLPFGKLLAATKDGRPIVHFPSYDDGFLEVVFAIKAALKLRAQQEGSTGGGAAAVVAASQSRVVPKPAAASAGPGRSSNLRIGRTFTDLERDKARLEGYEYIAGFFENSLAELKARNSGIDTTFRRIDADSFEAAIYRDGKKLAGCGIWTVSKDHFGGEIFFSQSGVTRSSFNESMSVHDDEYTLGFRPLGMSSLNRSRDELLSSEGAAELLWGLLIQPLR
jgi:hypothetical protein